MQRQSDKGNRIVILAIVGIVVLAIAGAFGSKVFFGAMAKRVGDRHADQKSTGEVLDAAEKLLEGDKMATQANFPDTPVGRMNRLVFELMLGEQTRQEEINRDLERIGWEWVMSAESLSTKTNLEESLRRLAQAKKITDDYYFKLESAYLEMLKKMDVEAQKDPDAEKFLAGFKDRQSEPGNGLYFANKISAELEKNHTAIGDCLRFLLARTGKFDVDADGAVSFRPPHEKETDSYNLLVDKLNASMEEMTRIEEERLRLMRTRINDARSGRG